MWDCDGLLVSTKDIFELIDELTCINQKFDISTCSFVAATKLDLANCRCTSHFLSCQGIVGNQSDFSGFLFSPAYGPCAENHSENPIWPFSGGIFGHHLVQPEMDGLKSLKMKRVRKSD